MKKKYKIFIAVLLILLAFLSFFAVKYWSLIKAVWDGFTLSSEKLQTMQIENDKKTTEIVEKLGVKEIKPLTEEEEKELQTGNISKEDALNIIMGNTTMEDIKTQKNDVNNGNSTSTDTAQKNPTNNNTSGNNTQSTTVGKTPSSQELDAANERISNLIGQIYVLKAQFKGELANVEAWVESEYRKLTKEEKAPKQSPAEQAIGRQMLNKVSKLEADCDAKMKSILAELKTLLKQVGQDTSLVEQIRDSYENEKQITKSYYISTYR